MAKYEHLKQSFFAAVAHFRTSVAPTACSPIFSSEDSSALTLLVLLSWSKQSYPLVALCLNDAPITGLRDPPFFWEAERQHGWKAVCVKTQTSGFCLSPGSSTAAIQTLIQPPLLLSNSRTWALPCLLSPRFYDVSGIVNVHFRVINIILSWFLLKFSGRE